MQTMKASDISFITNIRRIGLNFRGKRTAMLRCRKEAVSLMALQSLGLVKFSKRFGALALADAKMTCGILVCLISVAGRSKRYSIHHEFPYSLTRELRTRYSSPRNYAV